MKADKLYLGNIITLDPRNPVLKAMTVKDGLVQYIGTEKIARQLCDEHTEVIDFGDNCIYPGFMEAHCHGVIAGPRLAFFAQLASGESIADYQQILKDFMAEHPDNACIYGAGWRETNEEPNKAHLDAICPDKPMALHSIDGHSVWLNTLGLEKFGIDKAAAEKWGPNIVRVGADGEPTGYISEGPVNEIAGKMSNLSREENKQAMLVWQEFALSLGFTAYYEAGAIPWSLDLYRELIDEGKWKLRVYAGYYIDEHAEDYVAEVRKAKELADKYNCEYLKVIGVKIFMDGVVEAHTAWTLEDYADRPGYTGIKRFCDPERVTALYMEAAKLGLSVHQHTIGDGAVHFALDCIEKAQVATGNMDMRNCLAHLQMVSPEDVERLASLNAIALVAPLWMYRDEIGVYEQTIRYIGDKRTFYCYPMKSFYDHSGIIAFHSDYPVSTQVNVPQSVYMACKRADPNGGAYHQWNPSECIDRFDAVRAMTMGPAYSFKEEDRLGQLMIGYVANMSVFDKDFLRDDIETICDAKCIATIVDGEIVYKA
ncbi:MAG: amidohydrolase [Clostridia bacterium]|nr:amidohydrolase [Clostridia bacterium]